MLFIVAQGAAFGVLHLAGVSVDPDRHLTAGAALALVATQLISILVVIALAQWGFGGTRVFGGSADVAQIWHGVRALAPAALVVIAPTIALAVFGDERVLASGMDVGKAAAFVLLALAIAVNEELWFRGLVLHTLGADLRPRLAVFGSAALFGVPHVGDDAASLLNALAVALVVGIPFAVVRLRHGSLLPLIAWHAVIDIWAFVHTSSIVPEGDPSLTDIAASLILPLVVALGYLSLLRRDGSAAR